MTAITWGWSIEETAANLLEISTKARENGERYALMTAQNAAAAVERRNRSRA
jgi:homoserine acetyltransferase